MLFLAHPLLAPLDRHLVIAGEGLDPALIVTGAPREHLLGDRRHPDHLAEEVHDLLGPRQPGQVPMDDNAVETVVYKHQQAAKQLREPFHRSSLPWSRLDNKIIGQTPGGSQISNMFG